MRYGRSAPLKIRSQSISIKVLFQRHSQIMQVLVPDVKTAAVAASQPWEKCLKGLLCTFFQRVHGTVGFHTAGPSRSNIPCHSGPASCVPGFRSDSRSLVDLAVYDQGSAEIVVQPEKQRESFNAELSQISANPAASNHG